MQEEKSRLRSVFGAGQTILIALLLALVVRFYVVHPFRVRGASMEPNFMNGEYLLIDEVSYRFKEPQRGEVVVFRYPQEPSQFFIKRIIGLPGDKVKVEDGKVKIENLNRETFVLKENYLSPDVKTQGSTELTLKENEYFALGDNRAQSSDSRRWGSLNRKFIVGKVWLRLLPISRASAFETPEY